MHKLVRLAEQTRLVITDAQRILLDEINDFNLEARYPDFKHSFYGRCTEEYTAGYFIQIKEFFLWLVSPMQ